MTEAPHFDLHLLNATGSLRPVVSLLQSRIRSAHEEACRHLPLGPLDIVVQAGTRVVRGKGHVGHTPSASLVFLTVDPGDPALLADENRSLERLLAHEFHHAARWAGPGYGTTLGESLVSEGLACRFVREVYGPPKEPWETAVGPYEVKTHMRAARKEWSKADYDHDRWYHGTASLPNFLGYAMGSLLVDARLADHPDDSAAGLVHAPAESFRPPR